MFKAAVLAVVLALVGGPSATLLCGSWCDDRQTPPACRHDEATPAVAALATDACSGSELVADLRRQDHRRAAPGHERELQLPSAVVQLARPASALLSRGAACAARPLQRRPLPTQLRI